MYGASVWGFATKNRQDKLAKQQKKAIRNIHTLKYRDHTNNYFIKSRILKLPQLLEHTTMCYIQSGIHITLPWHISSLWARKTITRDDLRTTGIKLAYEYSGKDWIVKLAPTAQVKLWNVSMIDSNVTPNVYKQISKCHYLEQYTEEEDE